MVKTDEIYIMSMPLNSLHLPRDKNKDVYEN